MEGENQVNQNDQIGDQGDDKGKSESQQSLGWRAALPDEWKEHEFVKSYTKPGDFVKAAHEVKVERDELKNKMEGKILLPVLTDKSTDEDRLQYRKAIGVPDKPDDYTLPGIDGGEADPAISQWARGVFHKVQLSKSQAEGIGKEWNDFVTGTIKAQDELLNKEREKNEKDFRGQFESDSDYKEGYELSKRMWSKVTGTDFDAVYKGVDAWQVPLFMKFVFNAARALGEDKTPRGRSQGEEASEGMDYSKSPKPPSK